MVDWSALAAWGALALSVGNTIYAIRKESRKPIRERQQELRDRLRGLLKESQKEARSAIDELKSGSVPTRELPESLAKFSDQTADIAQDGITVPHSSWLEYVATSITYIDSEWNRAQRNDNQLREHDEHSLSTIEESTQRRTVSHLQLLQSLETFMSRVNKLIAALTKIDEGDKAVIAEYERYKSPY